MNLGEYVQELPQLKREQLYTSPWVCQALLRSLPPLAQQYIYNFLFAAKSLSADKISNWVVSSASKQHRQTLDLLQKINLLKSTSDVTGKQEFTLNPSFQQHLSWGIKGGGQIVESVPDAVRADVPSLEALDEYAQGRWEAMQLFLLTGANGPELPHFLREFCEQRRDVQLKHLLNDAGLAIKLENGQAAVSEAGFRFLLQDNHSQLWLLLRQYIRTKEGGPSLEPWAALMNFLMALGFRRVGQPYAWAELERAEAEAAAHLSQLGLLYPFMVGGDIFFCPTRLAASLCGGYTGDSSSRSLDGYIIVETNYRVYGYTSSHIQISILELFCRTDALLPNLYVGMITRDSIARALDSGISAEMMIGYLDQHAHPNVANKVPCVPSVVTDQIRIWERQTQRVRTTESILYDNFELPRLYELSLQYCTKIGGLLWSDPHGSRFIGSGARHPQMKDFIKRTKMELGAPPPAAPATRRTLGQ